MVWSTVVNMSLDHIPDDRYVTKIESSKKCYTNFSRAIWNIFMEHLEANFESISPQINVHSQSQEDGERPPTKQVAQLLL